MPNNLENVNFIQDTIVNFLRVTVLDGKMESNLNRPSDLVDLIQENLASKFKNYALLLKPEEFGKLVSLNEKFKENQWDLKTYRSFRSELNKVISQQLNICQSGFWIPCYPKTVHFILFKDKDKNDSSKGKYTEKDFFDACLKTLEKALATEEAKEKAQKAIIEKKAKKAAPVNPEAHKMSSKKPIQQPEPKNTTPLLSSEEEESKVNKLAKKFTLPSLKVPSHDITRSSKDTKLAVSMLG